MFIKRGQHSYFYARKQNQGYNSKTCTLGVVLLVSKRRDAVVSVDRQRSRRKCHCCVEEDKAYAVH